MPTNIFTWLLSLSPVIVILVMMLVFKWGGSKAGGVAWAFSILIAFIFFGFNFKVLLYSQLRGLFLALDVLLIIWAALLIYNVADEAGAVKVIGQSLPRLTPDRMMQGLLLGWLFASFLQGMGGFGVPVAVTAPLLVGLGFAPVEAVIMACLGHGWAVNFGSMATSFQTLIAVTGISGEQLAPNAALLLGLSAFACGALVALIAGGWKGLLRGLPAVVILTAVMGSVQYVLATNHLWTLGATGAAMVGLLVGVLLTRLPLYRKASAQSTPIVNAETALNEPKRNLWISLSAYAVLVVLAFGIKLIPAVDNFLSGVSLSMKIPELSTNLGFVTAAKATQAIKLFSHPGFILLYASIIAFIIYKSVGYYQTGAMKRIGQKVLKSSVNSSLGILAMLGMAMVMTHSGMTEILAKGLSLSFGRIAYPFVAPFIGALGAFITGSNNSSNVLFAALQMRTAELLNLPVLLILGAQTAGGSLGSIMAPAKVIVGCSTVGLGNNESKVMGKILVYGLIPVAFVAFLAFLFAL
jgi:lactate permease